MTNRKLPVGSLIALSATGLFLAILTSSTLISGVALYSQSTSSSGSITSMNIKIYSDSECNDPCSNIDWGILTPGNSTTYTIYLKNSGNKPIILSLISDNWIPINANNYLSLIWDKENSKLDPGQTTLALLTLTSELNMNSITNFDFNIIINGIEEQNL